MYQSLKILENWLKKPEPVTIAVVSKTWGSAPRRAGSIMVIDSNGRFEGSVSGGCIEGSVISEALALRDSQHKNLNFSVSSEQAWEVGLACGGEIEIELFKLSQEHLPLIQQATGYIKDRINFSLNFSKKDKYHACEYSETNSVTPILNTEDTLCLPIPPKNRIFIIGAVHIAQYLCPLAQSCDYDVTVIDPRTAFIENRSFKSAQTVADWPDEYFKSVPVDKNTALVTLTHDPKIDDAALIPALKSEAFYIGSLGSRKTHADRMERLKEHQNTDRINGPIGLNIGAANPAEIAVSIMAEITEHIRLRGAV